jgi:hypothetical protein
MVLITAIAPSKAVTDLCVWSEQFWIHFRPTQPIIITAIKAAYESSFDGEVKS